MPRLNWDDLRLFLAVARAGRLNGAGRALRIDQSTVARRLSALEEALGTRVLLRSPRGVQLTEAGATLLDHAERIEAELLAAAETVSGADAPVCGTVRLATPEAFGLHIVAPAMARLNALHPDLRLDLIPESRHVRLANRDADIAIELTLPAAGPVVARRLADYALGLYASRSYLRDRGVPANPAALSQHGWVGYIDDLIGMPELRVEAAVATPVTFRSTSSAAQYASIAGGCGIGWVHSYVAKGDDRLIRVLPELEERRSYWLAIHRDQRDLPRIRAVVAFLDVLVAESLRDTPSSAP